MKYQDLISKIEVFHKLALYGDRKSFLQRVEAQYATPPMSPVTEALKANPEGVAREVVNTFKPMTQYPAIDKNTQHYLNELGSPIKLVEDGKLGPNTQKALEWFRDTYKVPSAIQNKDLIAQVAKEYDAHAKSKNQIPFPQELNEQMAQRNRQEQLRGNLSPFENVEDNEYVANK